MKEARVAARAVEEKAKLVAKEKLLKEAMEAARTVEDEKRRRRGS